MFRASIILRFLTTKFTPLLFEKVKDHILLLILSLFEHASFFLFSMATFYLSISYKSHPIPSKLHFFYQSSSYYVSSRCIGISSEFLSFVFVLLTEAICMYFYFFYKLNAFYCVSNPCNYDNIYFIYY